jgi:hypothetical protein
MIEISLLRNKSLSIAKKYGIEFSRPLADQTTKGSLMATRKLLKTLEAAVGIEPTNKGFADLCLTTWLRRPRGIGMRAER